MGIVHSQIKSRSLPPPPSPAAAAALHHSSGTSDQIPSSSIVRGETLPARSEASSLSAPPPRVLRDGDRGLPCHRPRRGGLLWQGLQGQAQVHSPGQPHSALPGFGWILCLYNSYALFSSVLSLVQTVAMKFILKHGKTDKDIHNLRQEIEVRALQI